MFQNPFFSYLRRWYIKTISWEYWPMWVVYLPVSFYYIYLSIKAKSFFFFAASNPSIETGGMIFESKWQIFQLIPKQYYPNTIFIEANTSIETTIQQMNSAGIDYPIIAKPDRGEKGWCVQKIHTKEELTHYIQSVQLPFLIQSFVDYPIELSIFYYRHPNQEKGSITSITLKHLLTVVGDGSSTIEKLILKDNRAFLQLDALKQNAKIDFDLVLPANEKRILVPYGNHVRGAMFLDYQIILDETLSELFDTISKQINGFYYGRYDLRCQNIEALKQGKQFSILELNGAGAIPAHIFDPSFSFWKGQKAIAQHFKMLYDASVANHQKGVPYMTIKEYFDWRAKEKAFKQKPTS